MRFTKWDNASREERFIAKVDRSGDCWLWMAYCNRKGYGCFQDGNRNRRAHRVAYELFVGPIPDGAQLDHLCRVRNCVNPDHLEPVTSRQNTRRGVSAAKVEGRPWRQKTHCKHGHPYDDENTRIDKHGARWCRACKRRRDRAYRQGATK